MKKVFFLLFVFSIVFYISGCEHIHKYSEEVIESTCYEQGYTLYTCECGHAYKDDYKEIVHKFEDIHINPTCTSLGYEGKRCECGEEELNVIPMLEHEYVKEEVKSTCTSKGYVKYICDVCGDNYIDEYFDLIDHSFGEWYVSKEATYESDGLRVRECECGEVEEEIIPKLVKPKDINIKLDLDGGFIVGTYTSTEELAKDFIADYNKYSNTSATIINFLKDSSSSVKVALSNKEMLDKWNWLFTYMYEDLKEYNESINATGVSYVSDTLDLLPRLIDKDTEVIKDSSKGPNFRTLVRSYLHGVMNNSKGDPVGNKTFASYAVDFSESENQEKLLAAQYRNEITVSTADKMFELIKPNYNFSHWIDPLGNKTTKYTVAGLYKAVWDEGIRVDEINISNEINEIDLYETYQLIWEIKPNNAVNKKVEFISSDESILKINDNGLIETFKTGKVSITIHSLSLSSVTYSFDVNVVTNGYFDVSYDSTSYVCVGESIKLNAKYYDKFGEVGNVIFESLDESIASVDELGNVGAKKEGLVSIRAYSKDRQKYFDFMVTVVSKDISEALKLILDSHVSNVFTRYNIGIGAGTPEYYTDIYGSVSKLLFNSELEINTKYNQATNNKYGDELKNRMLESVEFITVHYTGGMSAGSTAEATAKYFAMPLSQVKTSIHYCTGNDGVFKGMDEVYRAAHAGDDGSLETVEAFKWLDTDVLVKENDPEIPVVSITKNATFSINGVDTNIKVPYETTRGRGYVTDDKWLNKMDLAVNIKDGKYQLGTSWWCYTQVWEGRICSNGGNRNSIGIESAVNKGSDLWWTWQKTAQLCADIMERYDLNITRVKGHHFFSAKNCPQPMLENDLEIWYEFLDLVRSEKQKLELGDITIEFSSNSNLVNKYGRVIKQNNNASLITYTISITRNGVKENITLGSIIEGNYNR